MYIALYSAGSVVDTQCVTGIMTIIAVAVCVCIDFFVCFSHKLPHITFLGQVGNLEGCGKVTFGLWKETEPAPCTRQASDGPYPWRIHVNVWQNQCSVVK